MEQRQDRNLLEYRDGVSGRVSQDYLAPSSWEDLDEQERKRPWRKVALAVFLCVAGAGLLSAGVGVWYTRPKDGTGAPWQDGSCRITSSSGSSASRASWRVSPAATRACAAAATALLVLGCVCFLPGFYHTRIAYLAWKGVRGYSLDSIPDF